MGCFIIGLGTELGVLTELGFNQARLDMWCTKIIKMYWLALAASMTGEIRGTDLVPSMGTLDDYIIH